MRTTTLGTNGARASFTLPEQWEQWLADTTCAQLLRHPPTDDAEAEAADGT